ncbi:MAG: hypothetical protein AB7C92_01035 [Synergistaceae bacterium]
MRLHDEDLINMMVLEAIKEGDPTAAAELMEEHLTDIHGGDMIFIPVMMH